MKKVRVGTDCSGIETILMTLDELGIAYEHVFSSEIDKDALTFIGNNFHPKYLYHDIRERDNTELKNEEIDLYVVGFPCQSFSSFGQKRGLDDANKGSIFFNVCDFIKCNRPKTFILENVVSVLTHNKGETLRQIQAKFSELEGYVVKYQIMDSRDFGLAQSRHRVYFVGTRTNLKFEFPKALDVDVSIYDFIDKNIKGNNVLPPRKQALLQAVIQKYPHIAKQKEWILNLNVGSIEWFRIGRPNTCPCLTVTNGDFYIVDLKRKITAFEALKLQGIAIDKYNWEGLSASKIFKLAGNAMSINVLKQIIQNIVF